MLYLQTLKASIRTYQYTQIHSYISKLFISGQCNLFSKSKLALIKDLELLMRNKTLHIRTMSNIFSIL